MAVVMQHFSATAQLLCAVSIPSLVPHGYLAVDFFFVLSGFIMSYTYLSSFETHQPHAFRSFLAKRVARIVPLNVAVLVALMILGAISVEVLGRNVFFTSDDLPFDLLANLLMLQGLGIGTNLNGPSWSISTEFAAYILFPGYVLLVFNRRKLISIPALVLAVSILCWQASLHPRLSLASDATGDQLVRCFTEFAIGMGSYRLYRDPRAALLIGSDTAAFSLAAAMIGCLLMRMDLPFALLCPFLIATLAQNRGRMDRLLSGRAVYFLGLVSYSLYLIHGVFRPIWLEAIRALHPAPVSAPSALLIALVGSLSVIPFAWIAYAWVERPGRATVRHLLANGLQGLGQADATARSERRRN